MKRIFKLLAKVSVPIFEFGAKGFSLLLMLILANYMSSEDFGVYNYVVSLVLMVSVFMDAGINNFVFNKSLQNETKQISKYLTIKFQLSLIILALFLPLTFIFINSYYLEITLYSFSLAITGCIFLLKFAARGQSESKLDIAAIMAEPPIKVLLVCTLFLFGTLTIKNMFISFLAAGIIAFAILIMLFKRKFSFKWEGFYSLKDTFGVIVESRRYIIYYLAMVGIQRLDVFFIKENVGFEEVAVFSSANNIYLMGQLVGRSLITSRLKSIIRMNTEGRDLTLIVGLFTVGAAVVAIISPYIFYFVFPETYADGANYLRILVVGIPFYCINTFFAFYNNYQDRTNVNVLVFVASITFKGVILYVAQFRIIEMYVYEIVGIEILITVFYILFYFLNKKHEFKFG